MGWSAAYADEYPTVTEQNSQVGCVASAAKEIISYFNFAREDKGVFFSFECLILLDICTVWLLLTPEK